MKKAISFFVYTLFLFCQKPTEKEIRLKYPETIAALPVKILAQKKIGGFTIKTQAFQDHALGVSELLRGEIDLLFTGTTLGAMQAEKGVQLFKTIVWGTASVILSPKYSTASIPKNEPWKILDGKKISLPFAKSPNDLQFERILQKLKIKVFKEYHPHIQAEALLLAEKLDAAVLPESMASRLVLEKNCVRLGELSRWEEQLFPELAPAPMVSLFISGKLAEYKTKILNELANELKKNLQEIESSPLQFKDFFPDISQEVFLESLKYTHFRIFPTEEEKQKTVAFLKFGNIEVSEDFFYK